MDVSGSDSYKQRWDLNGLRLFWCDCEDGVDGTGLGLRRNEIKCGKNQVLSAP